jgi:hypothetical protein
MKNEQVLVNFLNGRTSNTANLKSVGTDLINYQTRIAFLKDGTVFINDRKYSQTTSTITNRLKKICLSNSLIVNSYNPDKY